MASKRTGLSGMMGRLRSRLLARRLVRIAIVIVLLPLVLTLLYLVPFVHPVSTLMMQGSCDLPGLRPAMGAAGGRRAGAGAFRDHVGGRAVLLPSRHRPWRTEGRHRRRHRRRGDAWRLHHHHAVGEEPLSLVAPVRDAAQGRGTAARGLLSTSSLPKRRIMEIYLNIAEWGPNIYGIEAAAQHHFGRSAKNLTRAAGGIARRHAAQSDHPQSGQAGTGLATARRPDRARAPPPRATMSTCLTEAASSAASAKKSRQHWSKRHGRVYGHATF